MPKISTTKSKTLRTNWSVSDRAENHPMIDRSLMTLHDLTLHLKKKKIIKSVSLRLILFLTVDESHLVQNFRLQKKRSHLSLQTLHFAADVTATVRLIFAVYK